VGSIPEAARGPARDLSGGLAVEEIGDKMFLVADGDYQAMVADTGDGVVAFDAPWQSEYLAAIRRVSTAPVTHVVYSHSHYDHIGGAGHLAAPTVVASNCPITGPTTTTATSSSTCRPSGWRCWST